jgi:hypothetical protein
MQKNIDNGYHKFVYNDLGYDMKCVDIINAIETILDLYQHKKGRIDELKQELLQEKEKNKKLTEQICNKVEVEVLEEYGLKLKNSISKDKIKELKDFYIQEHKDKNIDLIPIKNIIDNLKLLGEE